MKIAVSLAVLSLSIVIAQAVPHKYRVSDPATATNLLARGGKIIADYGNFQWIELDTPALASLPKSAELEDESDVIELHAARLNTRDTAVKSLRKARESFSGKRLHLVQFAGPVKPEWLAALEKSGARIVTYVPNNAYLVYGDTGGFQKLQNWAGTNAVVQWEGAYADDYKINPRARRTNELGEVQLPLISTFTVQMVADDTANAATLAVIDNLKQSPIKRQSSLLGYLNVVVELPTERLADIAAQPDVVSIMPYHQPHKFDERQDQIIAGNLTGSSPTGPGYLAWLAAKGFTQAQFTASGFVVDVTDSGIDNGTTSPGHFGLYQGGNPSLGSRVVYNRLEGTANSGSTLSGCDGHGNLNSHIIAGYDNYTNFPHTDSAGFHYGLGVCPFVKVGSSVIFDPSTFTDPSYTNLQSRAYRDGARISANSWGADTAGAYDADAQAYDYLVRDAQPSGAAVSSNGNQEMVIVFAAGNAGSSAQTVGSPGTAKNVIVVGAAENVHSHSTANGGKQSNGNDGCSTIDTEADNANDMATFSSRGPCSDGRVKPDIIAPGTHITGGVGQSTLTTNGNGTAISCFTGEGVCGLPGSGTAGSTNNFFPLGQQFFTTSSGTSHSTPAVAGGCALLRQYFINNSLTPPSPAMTKAFLMNSARYMTGTGANDTLPSSNQGMGEMNLGTAFDAVPRFLRDQLSADKFTASGQTRTFAVTVSDGSKPVRVTVAWTDAPGSTTGNAYKNDLDLTVTINGNTYKGNVFSSSNSVTGGSADKKNNVESVFLPAGLTGSFTITVTAANINSDGVPNEAPTLDQDFALVIYNATETTAPVITTQPQSLAVALGDPASFSVTNSGLAPFGYQWFFNSNVLDGATNNIYSIASAQTTNAGSYFVVITNTSGSATSSIATLTVAVAPVIVSNPASLSLTAGSAASFNVVAVGAPTLAYQWQLNGTNIDDATASSFSKSNIQTNDAGSYTVIVSNYAGSITSAPATLTVNLYSANGVVISQIYGGGGNTSATYQNDYVELFNASGSAVDVSTWSIQYASTSGTTWSSVNLSNNIPAGHYYLIKLSSGGSTGSALPTADATGSINMSASNGKVALVTNRTALSGSNPVGGSTVKDFVGFGTANAYEGTGAAPAGGNASAIFRLGDGGTDTDDNAADFTTGTPNARNTSSGVSTGGGSVLDLAILKTHSGNFTQGMGGFTYTIIVTNVGNVASSGSVSVVDTLPSGLTATAISGTGWTSDLGTLTCTRADSLAAASSYPVITVTVTVATNAPASVTNIVTFSGGGDTNSLNNSASNATVIIATSTGGGSTGGTGTNYTGVLIGWNFSALTGGTDNFGTSPFAPATNAPNLSFTGLTRGSGVSTSGSAAARSWGGVNWTNTTIATAVTANRFVTFSLTASNGYTLSFSSVSRFDYRRSGSGATNGVLQYQIGSGAFNDITNLNYSSSSSSGASIGAIDLSTFAALQNVGAGTNVTFRIVNAGGNNSGGTWYLYDQANNTALDLAVQGTVTALTSNVTNPPAAIPAFGSPAFTGGQFQFNVTGTTGSNYVVQATTNLTFPDWVSLQTNAAPFTFIEPNMTQFIQRYYRILVAP